MRVPGLFVALALAGAACGPAPTPSPENMTGVLNEFATHGATVTDVLAGDAGCADSPLRSNGSRITLRLAADGAEYEVYLFRWRRPADYAAADAAFRQCIGAFSAANGSVAPEIVEIAPWRAYGAGWTFQVTRAVEQALLAAAGGG